MGHIGSLPPVGPSVVRVVATDANGEEIGRGFLEVAARGDGGAPAPRAAVPVGRP
jgi:hypothetical protein